MKLIFVDGGYNWYTIERAEHDNLQEIRQDGPNSYHFYYSGRIGNADVEGDASEMFAIADAILNGRDTAFKRCAVCHVAGGVEFSSPRNTIDAGPVIPVEDAKDLARQIVATLTTPASVTKPT